MPLVRTTDRLSEIVASTLTECMAPDDDVRYDMWIESYEMECGAPNCAGHCQEALHVLVQVLESEHTLARAHWSTDLSEAQYHPDGIPEQVREAWEQISFARQAHQLSDLDDQMDSVAEDHNL